MFQTRKCTSVARIALITLYWQTPTVKTYMGIPVSRSENWNFEQLNKMETQYPHLDILPYLYVSARS